VRLGVNLLFLVPGEVGGSETHARQALEALREVAPETDVILYTAPEARESFEGGGWRVVTSPVGSRSKPKRIAAEMTWLPLRARRDRIDLLHSMGTTTPLACPVPSVVSVLDLIYHHYPETFPRAARLGLELLVPRGARRADRVIASSEASKRDLVATLKLPPEKIDVVHLGFGMGETPDPAPELTLRERFGLSGRVILTVAPALRHKNLDRLIGAFARLARGEPELSLVIVGHAGLERDSLRRQAAELRVAERVVFTGWIEDAELEGLYRMADVFAYPSLMEGFGIPPLEAMRRELPVACSNASSLPEVVGDAAELFDPYDEAAIAAAIGRLLSDEARRAELVERARAQTRQFTWEQHARRLLEVYERALTAASPRAPSAAG
jgi:glycosyltransferase involved in cell wall biosynthesis